MEGLYTTKLEQLSALSDIYYMSCVESVERQHDEVKLAKAPVTLVLAVSLAYNVNIYTSPNKNTVNIEKNKVEWVYDKDWHLPGSSSSVKEGNLCIEVKQSPSYNNKSKKEIEADQARFERAKRVEILMASYKKNIQNIMPSYFSMWTMRVANNALSQLPYSDAILQYDKYDDTWQYNLYFAHGLELSVSAYVEEGKFEDVDFDIYHGGELIIANTMSLSTLVSKMKSIIAKVESNA